MEAVDIRLWNYIDGFVDAEESVEIERLIREDGLWKERYDAILQVSDLLRSGLEAEEPSMRFEQNVMEAIGKATIAPPTKKYLNKRVVGAVGLLVVIPLAYLLAYALVNMNWAKSAFSARYIHAHDINWQLSGSMLNLISMSGIILCLVALDWIFVTTKSRSLMHKKGAK